MKPATVLIFSLGLAGSLSAECTTLKAHPSGRQIWLVWIAKFTEIPYPEATQVCIGRQYFYEIKGGAQMASALDRQKTRIILRSKNSAHLRHELAHLYLDLAWKVLPYKISEPLVKNMEQHKQCQVQNSVVEGGDIEARWRKRHLANTCETELLLRDLLRAPKSVREALPLN